MSSKQLILLSFASLLSLGCDNNFKNRLLEKAASVKGPFRIMNITPADGATGVSRTAKIIVTFNEPVDANTFGDATFSLKQGATPISGNFNFNGTVATFTPASTLTFGQAYSITVDAQVKNIGGSELGTAYAGGFTVKNPLQILNTTPASGAIGISRLQAVFSATAEFNNDIDPATLAGNFKIVPAASPGSPIPGNPVTYADKKATFTAVGNLDFLTDYKIIITADVKDTGGDPVPYTEVTFTTGTQIAEWAHEAYVKASNANGGATSSSNGDIFGHSVALDGNTLVVGAPEEDSNQTSITNGTGSSSNNANDSSGAVYVYVKSGGTWTQQAYIKAVNNNAVDTFGESIAISGNTLVVGASNEDSNQTTITNGATASSNNDIGGAGAAYVYVRSGSNWSQQAYLKASNADSIPDFSPGDGFGSSVAIDANTIVVGAQWEDSSSTAIVNGTGSSSNNAVTSSGAVYVYVRTGSSWSQQAYLKPAVTDFSDQFGADIAIFGDTIAVAAANDDSNQTTITNGTGASSDNSKTDSGAVHIVVRSGANWSRQAYIKAANADANDRFGGCDILMGRYSIALFGDTLVVGACNEASGQAAVTNGAAASGDNSAPRSGAAYVYQRTGASWAQEAYLKPSNVRAETFFGSAVAIYGDTIVVGSQKEASAQNTITNGSAAAADNGKPGSGAAYVFTRTGVNWAQTAYLKAPNADTDDNFGSAVAVRGSTIVVGAPWEDSNQTSITHGTSASANNSAWNSGAAYVFSGF